MPSPRLRLGRGGRPAAPALTASRRAGGCGYGLWYRAPISDCRSHEDELKTIQNVSTLVPCQAAPERNWAPARDMGRLWRGRGRSWMTARVTCCCAPGFVIQPGAGRWPITGQAKASRRCHRPEKQRRRRGSWEPESAAPQIDLGGLPPFQRRGCAAYRSQRSTVTLTSSGTADA